MALKHDQLLTQECVFQHQFRLAAGQVQSYVQDQSVIVGFCPLAEASFDSLAEKLYTLSEKSHGLPFRLGFRGHDSQNGVVVHSSRTDVLFGQDSLNSRVSLLSWTGQGLAV